MIRTKDMTLVAAFAALTAICSWISIPAAVPFTMQLFAVFLSVGLLGGRRGTLAVAVYILLGAAGAPVFSGFKGGVGVLLGDTGGYIAGFVFAAAVMGLILRLTGGGGGWLPASMAAGLLVCYAFGTAWFVAVYTQRSGEIGIIAALSRCVFPCILPDILKIAAACALTLRLKKAPGVQRLLT